MKTDAVSNAATIQSRKDYKDTPAGQYEYWDAEITGAQKTLGKWQKQGDKIVSRYLDSKAQISTDSIRQKSDQFKLNLFHSNTKTLYSMLYGNVPTVDVSRRYNDANDDVGRVAAETVERLLNCDIAENGKEYDVVLRSALLDRLLPGLATAKVRYEFDTEMIQEVEVVTGERAPIEYVYWNDVLWSWARNWSEVRWIAFRNYLTKDEVEKRFGEKAAKGVELKQQESKNKDNQDYHDNVKSVWARAEIWEIWDKQKRKVVWYSKGYQRILDTKDDPLQLKDFYPCPPFFIANPTTTLYIPTPDFSLCQDLYNEIDTLQTRIAIITEACKVVGVYDASADGIKRMFKEGIENELIPVDSWAMFAEKGGLQGQVDWFPIEDVVNALDKLRGVRDETIDLLQQVSGMSDIMRGGVNNQYEGVGQSQMKAKFGSIRVQALQDEFAQFASDLLQLKAEVIARHFDPESIAAMSNMQHSMDRDLLPQAIELIKQPQKAKLRIVIRPESVAMVDYAQLKSERTDYINALSMFMQSAAPLMEQDQRMTPFMLEMLKWGLAGFKGAQEIEGVMDKAIESTMQEAQKQQEQPDPAAIEAQKQQQMAEMKMQMEMQKIQAKAQADMQVREQDKQADIATAQAQNALDIQKIQAESQAAILEIQAKSRSDILTEQVQSQANIQQSIEGTNAEVEKEALKAEMEMAKTVHKAEVEMAKTASDAEVDMVKNAVEKGGDDGQSDL